MNWLNFFISSWKLIDFTGINEAIFSRGIWRVFIPSSLNHILVQFMDLHYLIWSRSTEKNNFWSLEDDQKKFFFLFFWGLGFALYAGLLLEISSISLFFWNSKFYFFYPFSVRTCLLSYMFLFRSWKSFIFHFLYCNAGSGLHRVYNKR